MMKNKVFLIGLASLALIFGLAGCANPAEGSGGGGTIYTVTFDANGGTVSPQTIEVEEGKAITSLPTPEKTSGDTHFWGWYTANGSGGNWGSRFTGATPVTSDITVYARWESTAPTTYTVTFNSQGGSDVPGVSVNSGDTLGNLPKPTRTGFTFEGWFTEVNGGGSQFTKDTQVTANITVYAKWGAGGVNSSVAKTLKITGISTLVPPISSTTTHLIVYLIGDLEDKNSSPVAGALVQKSSIAGDALTVQLKSFDPDAKNFSGPNWTGSGSYHIVLQQSSDGENFAGIVFFTEGKINFTSETTTVAGTEFEADGAEDIGGGVPAQQGVLIIQDPAVMAGLFSSHYIIIGILREAGETPVAGRVVEVASLVSNDRVPLYTFDGAGSMFTVFGWAGTGAFHIVVWESSDGVYYSEDTPACSTSAKVDFTGGNAQISSDIFS